MIDLAAGIVVGAMVGMLVATISTNVRVISHSRGMQWLCGQIGGGHYFSTWGDDDGQCIHCGMFRAAQKQAAP